VRWGNVAQLAALVVAAALIAFGVPAGCGSEPESIPLDALPGEPVEAVLPPRPRLSAPRPPRVQLKRSPRPVRRRKTAGLGRAVVVPSVAVVRRPRGASSRPRRRGRVPEAAREFSFDR
jgi:hypothetical protein